MAKCGGLCRQPGGGGDVELSGYAAIGGAMHRRGGACAGMNGD